MDSKRSTRRSVNPPESDQESVQEETSDSLTDVESILDEIESLVAGGGSEGTAKPTSVVESLDPEHRKNEAARSDVDPDPEDPNIEQLSVDLDAAIAAELNQLEQETQLDRVRDESGSESEDPSVESTEIETPEVVDETTIEQTDDDPEVLDATVVSPGMGQKVLRIMSGPIPDMSRGSRTVVSVFAVSLAIWVPLVWMLALTRTPVADVGSPSDGVDSISSADVEAIDPPPTNE